MLAAIHALALATSTGRSFGANVATGTAVLAVLEGVGATFGASGEGALASAHGIDTLGGRGAPCTTTATVLVVLGQIIAVVTTLGELRRGAYALGINTLGALAASVTTMTTIFIISEHVNALAVASKLAWNNLME